MTLEQLKNQDKKYAQVISDYLLKRIETDKCLEEKILETTSKTLMGCIEYCKTQAREQAVNGVAMVTDEEVFEWSVHYFLEDTIEESLPTTKMPEIKEPSVQSTIEKKGTTKKKDAKKVLAEQLSLFDL